MSRHPSSFESPLPFLPMRDGVLFPGATMSVPVGRSRSVALVRSAREGDTVAVGVQRDPRIDDPAIADLIPLATRARVVRVIKVRRNRYQLMLEGLARVHLDGLLAPQPYWRAEVRPTDEIVDKPLEVRALVESLQEKLGSLSAVLSDPLKKRLQSLDPHKEPGFLADIVASALSVTTEREIAILSALDVAERLRMVYQLLVEAETMADIKESLSREMQREMGKNQREAMLREQLKAIRKELGEGESGDGQDALRKKLAELDLPEDAREVVDKELERLQGMNSAQAEHGVIVKYLEFIASLPWNDRAEVNDDLTAVEQTLDDDHYGLDDVKERILEHLAVRKMTGNQRGAILCLVGPPGVGKTSLGQSVADATGRPFVRVALGGVRDEADVRGHRRTYVGALPGRILNALVRGKAKNPVMLLDEIDKLGHGWLGSPEAALLEVLDPEQNHTFTDHYLDLAFDLSEVFFICTANTIETLSPPLRDRLEIIELQGYTMDEKAEIAKRHLLPKKLDEHGLAGDALTISADALSAIIRDYTREAGVRQLTRELTKICRAITLKVARKPDYKAKAIRVEESDVHDYLGKPRFFNDVAERLAIPGVATGLAWTQTGGDILFIESSRMHGKGRLEITGQLGDVMKESARAALTYVRSHADEFGVEPDFLESQDLHVHVPAGAVPKDGPSAGVTIFTALTSLLTGRRVRSDTAMTGECTLRGRVLPVGGIKAKVLAAHRAGIKRVILPKKNHRDIDDVPVEVRDDLEFIMAEDMTDVLAAALEGPADPGALELGRDHINPDDGVSGADDRTASMA
ncbi:MAG: endopeptidase La [Proteobacteria bacterium]|nr:endopeptidase La [Pseudomonadota bacterium]